jgi:glycosyltransferase involved in cell wall biosynthesis
MSVTQSEPATTNRGEKDAPLLSVIIPAYNVSRYIAEALDSALAQTYSNIEIIVVNDGSPDTEELERVLLPYQGKFIYLKHENRGISGARNTAVRVARGKYVALLDADDSWLPGYVAVQTAIMEQDPTIDVLYPDGEIFGEVAETGHTYMETCPSVGEVTFAALLRQECNVMICATIRRDTLLRLGMFDEDLRSVEDFDLWLRVVKSGGKISYHRQVLARHRKRMGSLSSNDVAMRTYGLKVLDKTRDTMVLTPFEASELKQARDRFQADLHLTQGKIALVQRDFAKSAALVKEANRHFKSVRLDFFGLLLRTVPSLVRAVYQFREAQLDRQNGVRPGLAKLGS